MIENSAIKKILTAVNLGFPSPENLNTPHRYSTMAIPIAIHKPMKISLSKRCHCFTRSAFDKNLIAIANSMKPNTAFSSFIQPPDLGIDCNQCGNRANRINGNPNPNPKPAIPAVNCQAPLDPLSAPTNRAPKMPLVQENETMAKVNAMKKIPSKFPNPAFESALLAKLLGSVISK